MRTKHLFAKQSIEMSSGSMASSFTDQQVMVTHLIFYFTLLRLDLTLEIKLK